MTKNPALEFLHCSRNQLTELDLTNNTNLNSLNLQSQTTAAQPAVKTANGYKIDLGTLVGAEDMDKITTVSGKDDGGNALTGVYDATTGIATFQTKPKSITYNYLPGYVADATRTMDVTAPVVEVVTHSLTYTITGEAPATSSPAVTMNKAVDTPEGATVAKPALTTTETTNAAGKTGTWKFNGWTASTALATGDAMPTSDVTMTGTWTFTEAVTPIVTPVKPDDPSVPKTGDTGTMGILIALLALSAVGGCSFYFLSTKKQNVTSK